MAADSIKLFDINGKVSYPTTTPTYTIQLGNYLIECDATDAEIQITLPSAATSRGRSIYIKKTDSSGNNVVVNADGSDTIDDASTLTISSQYSCAKLFCTDFDSAATEAIASFGGTFTPLTSAETFTITYNNATDGDGTTGATELTFFYIDSSGLPATTAHTLGSDGSDVTAFTGLGINRVAVSASGTADVNTNTITITATTAGTNQAQIPALEGVTQQAIFFNGSNHKALMKNIYLNARKLSGGSAPRVTFKGWIYNRAVDTKFEIFRWNIDTAIENTVILNDEIGFVLNETDVLYFEGTTNTNDTAMNVRFGLNQYQNT